MSKIIKQYQGVNQTQNFVNKLHEILDPLSKGGAAVTVEEATELIANAKGLPAGDLKELKAALLDSLTGPKHPECTAAARDKLANFVGVDAKSLPAPISETKVGQLDKEATDLRQRMSNSGNINEWAPALPAEVQQLLAMQQMLDPAMQAFVETNANVMHSLASTYATFDPAAMQATMPQAEIDGLRSSGAVAAMALEKTHGPGSTRVAAHIEQGLLGAQMGMWLGLMGGNAANIQQALGASNPHSPKLAEELFAFSQLLQSPNIRQQDLEECATDINKTLFNYACAEAGNDPRARGIAERVYGLSGNPRLSGNPVAEAAPGLDVQSALAKLANDPNVKGGTQRRAKQLATAHEDYQQALQDGVRKDPKYQKQLDKVMNRVEDRMGEIDQIAAKADLPRELVAAIWYRENADMSKGVYLHNGQKLGTPTTMVPRGVNYGRGEFVDAAVDALQKFRTEADALGLNYESKDLAAMASFTEAYNGFGYRGRGVASAYVSAGTDKYQGGLYVADGQFKASARDNRPGTLAVMMEMQEHFSAMS